MYSVYYYVNEFSGIKMDEVKSHPDSPCINILRALAGANWGQQEETILITYLILYMYVAPIWFSDPNLETTKYPNLCPPHRHRLR